MSTVLVCSGEKKQNLHSGASKYSLPNLHKSLPLLNYANLTATHEFNFYSVK